MKFGHFYAANFLGRVASIFPELLLNYAGRKYLTAANFKNGARNVPFHSAELGIPSE